MMADDMRDMLDLKQLATMVNGVHNPNADAYRERLKKKMAAIPEYAYLNSLKMEDFKTLDDLYAKMRSIKSEDELEKLIVRTPDAQKDTFRRIWKQLPTSATA